MQASASPQQRDTVRLLFERQTSTGAFTFLDAISFQPPAGMSNISYISYATALRMRLSSTESNWGWIVDCEHDSVAGEDGDLS